MAQKLVDIPGIGEVLLAKRKGSRNLRLSIRPDGSIRVGLPAWAPYAAGIKFAESRAGWINQRRPRQHNFHLAHGMRVGKSYRLAFLDAPRLKSPRAKLDGNQIIISAANSVPAADIQKAAHRASEKALKKDAEKLLVIRLEELAGRHGFKYAKVTIKKLKSRWGSCSSNQEIALNYYLIQLPWRLIDYVIVHELAHTKHLNHGKPFWDEVARYIPDVKACRSDIKKYPPVLAIN